PALERELAVEIRARVLRVAALSSAHRAEAGVRVARRRAGAEATLADQLEAERPARAAGLHRPLEDAAEREQVAHAPVERLDEALTRALAATHPRDQRRRALGVV